MVMNFFTVRVNGKGPFLLMVFNYSELSGSSFRVSFYSLRKNPNRKIFLLRMKNILKSY